MSIPFRRDRIIKLKGERKSKPIKMITESLGSFSNQEEVSNEITSMFRDMYLKNVNENEHNFIIDNIDILFKLVLKTPMTNYVHANITPYGSKTKIDYIELVLTVPNEIFDYNKVKETISHELMHGNIFSKMVANKGNLSVPDIYAGLIDIISKDGTSLLYYFAYGLYATFYQEQQAIVSSVFSQLVTMFYGKNLQDVDYDMKVKIYKKALVNTEAYQTYYYILKTVIPQIEALDEYELGKLTEQFKKHNVNIDIKKECKIMRRKCISALKDICRAGSNFFYKNIANN